MRRGLHLAGSLALGQVPRSDAPALVVTYLGAPQDGSELDLGGVNTAAGAVKTFGISNTGRSTGTWSIATSSPSNTTAAPSTSSVTLAPGASTTFTVTVDPTAAGALSFSLAVGALTVPCVATGIEQDIAITDPDAGAIADGGTYSSAGGTDGVAASHVWGIANTGTDTLGSISASITGTTNCTATITDAPPTTLAASASDTWTVQVTPTAAGAWSYTVDVVSDDPDTESTYTVGASGTAAAAAASTGANLNIGSVVSQYECLSRTGTEGTVGFQHGDAFAFVGWLTPTLGAEGRVWGLGTTVGPRVHVLSDGRLRIGVYGANWNKYYTTAWAALIDGADTFVEILYDPTGGASYCKVNGWVIPLNLTTTGSAGANTYTGYTERWGAQNASTNAYLGKIGVAAIFNAAPSAGDISALYARGKPSAHVAGVDWVTADITVSVPDTAGGGAYTSNNIDSGDLLSSYEPAAALITPMAHAIDLGGTDEYLLAPARWTAFEPALATAYTMWAFVKAGTGYYNFLGTTSSISNVRLFEYGGASLRGVRYETGQDLREMTSPAINDGKWHFIALICSGGTGGGEQSFYFDGAAYAGSAVGTQNLSALGWASNARFALGAYKYDGGSPSYVTTGKIGRCGWANAALSAATLRAIMLGADPSGITGMLDWWNPDAAGVDMTGGTGNVPAQMHAGTYDLTPQNTESGDLVAFP